MKELINYRVCDVTETHLLVSSSAPGHQYYVEASKACYWDEEEASDTHDSHAGRSEIRKSDRKLCFVIRASTGILEGCFLHILFCFPLRDSETNKYR